MPCTVSNHFDKLCRAAIQLIDLQAHDTFKWQQIDDSESGVSPLHGLHSFNLLSQSAGFAVN